MPNFTETGAVDRSRLVRRYNITRHRLAVRLLPVAQGRMPIRFTPHEAIIWYRLKDEWTTNPGGFVPYGELLTLSWGTEYLWDDPDLELRVLNRGLLYNTVYVMRRLLAAHGGFYAIETRLGEGMRLTARLESQEGTS